MELVKDGKGQLLNTAGLYLPLTTPGPVKDECHSLGTHSSDTLSTVQFASTLLLALSLLLCLGPLSMLLRIERPPKQSKNSWVRHFSEPISPSPSPYSLGCGCYTRCPDYHRLHWGRHCSWVHSSQDDVCCSNCQWRWSCSRKHGSHTPVSG